MASNTTLALTTPPGLPRNLTAIAFAPLILYGLTAVAQDAPLKTRAEATGYQETSRYDDVIGFIDALQARSPLLRVETFGRSHEGRALPLLVLADPPVSSPEQARAAGKPVVFVMANIHAGEVEGKEAAQLIAQRLLTGDLRPLLRSSIVLIAPIYNADGNEKINPANRHEQNGPIAGVGLRENAQGLDLNRDFIKLDAPETRALVRLFNRWDPHLTVDLHTTNGSYHGYHLTYSIPLNPATDPGIIGFERATMMPTIALAMRNRHQYRSYYYGNFSGAAPALGEPDRRTWRAFTHQPRIGQNYAGLRNRLAILSEAYSYLDFRARIEVTEAFVEEIIRFVDANAAQLTSVTRRADEDAAHHGLGLPLGKLGVKSEIRPLPAPVDILIGEVSRVKNPRSGLEMTVVVADRFKPVRMLDFGQFAATHSVPSPRAYLVPDEPGLRVVIDKLIAHGVAVEQLIAPLTAEVERFVIDGITRAERPFQGHREVKLSGRATTERVISPAGTFLIRTAQPLGRLASYLLEPESDDGLVTWGLLDAYLAPGKGFPVSKVYGAVNARCRLADPIDERQPVDCRSECQGPEFSASRNQEFSRPRVAPGLREACVSGSGASGLWCLCSRGCRSSSTVL